MALRLVFAALIFMHPGRPFRPSHKYREGTCTSTERGRSHQYREGKCASTCRESSSISLN